MKQQEPPILIDLAAASAPEQAQAERQALAASHAAAAARQDQQRTLLVISAEVKHAIQPEIAAGRYPRKDYFELADALQADILDWTAINAHNSADLLARVAVGGAEAANRRVVIARPGASETDGFNFGESGA